MKITIRNPKYTDLATVSEINRKCMPENYSSEYWKELRDQHAKHCFVAVFGGQIIGYCFATANAIISIAIEEAYRRKGLARALLMHTLDSMQGETILQVRSGNLGAIALYENLGFKYTELLRNYYSNPAEDAWLMTRGATAKKFGPGKKMKIYSV